MKLKLTAPASAFLKPAHFQAKIISKVIHQPHADALTRSSESASAGREGNAEPGEESAERRLGLPGFLGDRRAPPGDKR